VRLSSNAKIVFLYALRVTGKNRSGDYIRFSHCALPAGCMAKRTFNNAMMELRNSGFLQVVFKGEFHNKKGIYKIK